MTGSDVALDTNLAIAILNGDGQVTDWANAFARLFIPVPVLAELRFGAMNSGHASHNLARAADLVSRCTVLDATSATATEYARLRVATRRVGRPIPVNDLWIAATCVEHRVPLGTTDAHFDHIPGLKVVRP